MKPNKIYSNIGKEKMNQVYADTFLSNLSDVGIDPGVQQFILMNIQHLITVMHYHAVKISSLMSPKIHFSNNTFSFLLQMYRFILLHFLVLEFVVNNKC